MPAHLPAEPEKGIRWQVREQKTISPKVTRQKGKAGAPEAQGQMSRKSICHLSTLGPEDEGGEPGHGSTGSQEGRIQLVAHWPGPGKGACRLREEELQHKFGGR